MLQDGDIAPDFELPTDAGGGLKLSRLRANRWSSASPGRYVRMYDRGQGLLSGLAPEFHKAGVEVVGLSPDSVESHLKFRSKHGLTVRLAADADKAAAMAYGVWVQKSMYGRTYMGIEALNAFLIDKAGRLARSWRKGESARSRRKRCSPRHGRSPNRRGHH